MTSPLPDEPPAIAAPTDLRSKERAENFPVAMRLLPRAYRRDLRAVYGVVRVIDDLGDEATGDRTAQLRSFAADLGRAWQTEEPQWDVCRALKPVVASRGITQRPFDDLIEANLMDQHVKQYDDFEQLHGYCMLSAAPIGRLVLEVFGQSSPRNLELSDRICVALQLLEHWQDVAQDHRAGRTYLPAAALARFEVTAPPLAGASASPELRRLVLFETSRASDLLKSGSSLPGRLHGWARLAVAGYLAGGRATVEALQRADGDVLTSTPRPRRRDLLRHLGRGLGRAPA